MWTNVPTHSRLRWLFWPEWHEGSNAVLSQTKPQISPCVSTALRQSDLTWLGFNRLSTFSTEIEIQWMRDAKLHHSLLPLLWWGENLRIYFHFSLKKIYRNDHGNMLRQIKPRLIINSNLYHPPYNPKTIQLFSIITRQCHVTYQRNRLKQNNGSEERAQISLGGTV